MDQNNISGNDDNNIQEKGTIGKWQWIIDIIAIVLGGVMLIFWQAGAWFIIGGLAILLYGLFELIFNIFKLKNFKMPLWVTILAIVLILIFIFGIGSDQIANWYLKR